MDTLNKYSINNEQKFDEDISNLNSSTPSKLILTLVLIGFIIIQTRELYYPYMYESFGYLVSIGVVIISAILFFLSNRTILKDQFASIIIIICLIVYTIVSANLNGGGFRYSGAMINTAFAAVIMAYSSIDKRYIKIFFLVLILATIRCSINVTGYFDRQYVDSSVNSNILSFFGLSVLVYGHFCLDLIKLKNRPTDFILKLLLALSSLYIILQCESRGTIFAWLFFIVFVYVIPFRLLSSKKFMMAVYIIITISSIAFSYIYINNISYFGSFVLMGKSGTTRNRIWSYVWNTIADTKKHFFLGHGTANGMREFFGYGAHNVNLCLLYEIGLIGFILFTVFIIYRISRIYETNKDEIGSCQMYALVGFMTYMVYDFFGDEFLGPLAVWSFVLIGIANKKNFLSNVQRLRFVIRR